jgi:hypothetical protein
MTEDYKQICLSFYNKAHKKIGLQSGFDKLYYADAIRDICSALEGFFKYKKYTGSNRDKIEKFDKDYKILFKYWKKTDLFKQGISILIRESPVENIDNRKKFSITNNSSLEEILNFTFVPRGNLTHAEKDLLREDKEGQRNRDLVEFSFKVMHEILQMILSNEKMI